jgi:hypothetical protein
MATRTAITPTFTVAAGQISQATAAYNQPAGDTITVCVMCESDAVGTVTTIVTDTAGNTYTILSQVTDGGNLQKAQIFYIINCAAHATNVITASFSGNTVQKVVVEASRWTPVGTVTFRAQPAGATGTSTTPATAAFNAGDFAVAAAKKWTMTTHTAGSGWTDAYSGTADGTEAFSMYRNDSPGGTYTASSTETPSDTWSIVAASFLDTPGPAKSELSMPSTFMSMSRGFR